MNAPTPIPLRADPSATQRAAMQSLTRACLGVGLRALNRSNGVAESHRRAGWVLGVHSITSSARATVSRRCR
jgi:hypothetical protein